MITETREVFEVNGNIMQVVHCIHSERGLCHDVILIRSYARPNWKRNPYVQAIQISALERMIDEDKVRFPTALGQQAVDFSRNWPPDELVALSALISKSSH